MWFNGGKGDPIGVRLCEGCSHGYTYIPPAFEFPNSNMMGIRLVICKSGVLLGPFKNIFNGFTEAQKKLRSRS